MKHRQDRQRKVDTNETLTRQAKEDIISSYKTQTWQAKEGRQKWNTDKTDKGRQTKMKQTRQAKEDKISFHKTQKRQVKEGIQKWNTRSDGRIQTKSTSIKHRQDRRRQLLWNADKNKTEKNRHNLLLWSTDNGGHLGAVLVNKCNNVK